MPRRWMGRLLLAASFALWPAAPASAASLWTPTATPTTHTITAIAYPRPDEVVFTTNAGEILHRTPNGTYTPSKVIPADPAGFTDIAMSGDGLTGITVGPNGAIYRSTDAGANWSPVTGTLEPSGTCAAPGTPGALADDLLSVHFADPSTVYVTGSNGDLLASLDGGMHFTEVNKSPGGCVADPGGAGQAFTDTAWLDATHGFLVSNYFGRYYSTSDGLRSAITVAQASGSGGPSALAVDGADPLRAWSVAPASTGLRSTLDGGSTWSTPRYDGMQLSLRDIATASATVVTVGDGGDIYTSPDGVNFYRQIGAPPNAARDWRAVALLDGQHAVVGGAGGVVLYTPRADQPPDTIPPTGTVAGPARLIRGRSGTYTASITDNPGGSGVDRSSFVWSTPDRAAQRGAVASFAFSSTGTHVITLSFRDLAGNASNASITVRVGLAPPSGSDPTSATVSGTTITLYRRVTITSRAGRWVPVVVSTDAPCKLEVAILTAGHDRVAAGSATLRRKGTQTIQVPLSKRVAPGRYVISVRLLTLTGHDLGRMIAVPFVLA